MHSSTSSSDPAAWRRFLGLCLAVALGGTALVYAFVAIIAPWGMLPLAPPLPRVPVSSNARFSFPALAASPRFDSAIIGTSTARLLRPAALDPLFHARFVNLSMNAATAYEQSRLLRVFLRAHEAPRVVAIGLDVVWCRTGATYAKFTPRPFPAWMYGDNRWTGYLHLLSLYAVQEAGNQLGVMLGLKRREYGLDGYTNFTPPESEYDPARAHAHILAEPPDVLGFGNAPPAARHFPTHALLAEDLARMPAATRKLLFFVPYYRSIQGAPGSLTARLYAECKRRITRLAAATPNATVVDFMIDSPITRSESNYWDPRHFRTPIADRLARDLALAADGKMTEDDRILSVTQTSRK